MIDMPLTCDYDRIKSLSYILACRDIKKLDVFLRKYPEALYSELYDQTLLQHSAQHGHHKAVIYLIERGLDVNDNRGTVGYAPLHYAAQKNSCETMAALFKAGAAVNAKNRSGETALHRAVTYNNSESVEILIQHGADINAQDKNGDTPLHINELLRTRGDFRYHSRELDDRRLIARLLCDNGADVLILNRKGRTAVDIDPIC